jgi:predicted RNase H-like HicB family nuclease
MKAEFTAIIEAAPEGGYWAICPEIPGANGQGDTPDEAKDSLREALELILDDRLADILRGLPKEAIPYPLDKSFNRGNRGDTAS